MSLSVGAGAPGSRTEPQRLERGPRQRPISYEGGSQLENSTIDVCVAGNPQPIVSRLAGPNRVSRTETYI
jgi:hypothetical protein